MAAPFALSGAQKALPLVLLFFFLLALVLRTAAWALSGRRPLLLARRLLAALLPTLFATLALGAIRTRGRLSVGPLIGGWRTAFGATLLTLARGVASTLALIVCTLPALGPLSLLLGGTGRRPLALLLRGVGSIGTPAVILRSGRRSLPLILGSVRSIALLRLVLSGCRRLLLAVLRRIGPTRTLTPILRCRWRSGTLTPILRCRWRSGTLTLILRCRWRSGALMLVLRRRRCSGLLTLLLRRRRCARLLALILRGGRSARCTGGLAGPRAGGAGRIVAQLPLLTFCKRLRGRDAIRGPDRRCRLPDRHTGLRSAAAPEFIGAKLDSSWDLRRAGQYGGPHFEGPYRTTYGGRNDRGRNARIDRHAALANHDRAVDDDGLAENDGLLARRQHDGGDTRRGEIPSAHEQPDVRLFPVVGNDVIRR
jgi:hypothetical protein